MSATTISTLEVPVRGMDCTDCAAHVRHAIAALPGVDGVDVFLASEKAVVRLDPARVSRADIAGAVAAAGYACPAPTTGVGASDDAAPAARAAFANTSRMIFTVFGLVFGAVLLIVVAGEWFGLFDAVTERVPFPVGLALVLCAGGTILWGVLRDLLHRRVTSHTLMTIGLVAALVVGQWTTALIVVFFMRVGGYTESFTTERGRRALKELVALAPATARVERAGGEREVPVGEVVVGETVIVRPGENIPVDGEVIAGTASVMQAAITGESMPVDVDPGSRVFAATSATGGALRLRVTRVGADSTYGKIVRLVEEAETHRADAQRLGDRFATWYIPVVAAIALLTFLLRRDPLAVAAVLVVACSCSFALATPIAMLASIGVGAKRGVLIKGGKYLETLARADVLLVDKTGTLTLGRPQVTQIVTLGAASEADVLRWAATAERYSEHPLAEAVRRAARERGLSLGEPGDFRATAGVGVEATVDGMTVTVGSRRAVPGAASLSVADALEGAGQTTLIVVCDGVLVGVIATDDTVRPEVPAAITAVRSLGVKHIELLTGDNAQVAAALAGQLGVEYRAGLLPEDKIARVREWQAQGHRVVMVGDGVNDAPALAQADVGIAMGAAGTDVAMDAAHLVLMRDDWTLVPVAFRIAQRTMRTVRANLAFTVIYNLVGLSLASVGILPPILAAAAQSLPDVGILANSSRLLRQRV